MSRQSIKALIDANIKRNGQREITGQILNSVLNAMNDGYSPVVDSFVLDGNTITVLKNLDLEGINQSVDSSKMVDTDGKTFAEKFAQGGGETGCKSLYYTMEESESGELSLTESESQKALNTPVYQGILDKTVNHLHVFAVEPGEQEGEINAVELLSSQIVVGETTTIVAGSVVGTNGIGAMIIIENLALSSGAVFTFELQQALTEQQLLNIGRIPSKTEKVRIDIVQHEDTYLFKKGNVALNFAELNNMLQNTPDFLIFVHGNREHRCIFIDTTSSQKVMRFVAPIVSDGVLKTQSFSVFSNDGVVITAVTKTDINCENSSNKVQSIVGAGTASAYPSTKAVVDYAAKKSELEALSLKVGKFSEITPTLSSGVQIATLKKEVEGQEVETPLYAPQGGGGANFDKLWESFGCVKNADGTWTLGYITDLTEAELWEAYGSPILNGNDAWAFYKYTKGAFRTNLSRITAVSSIAEVMQQSSQYTQLYLAPKDSVLIVVNAQALAFVAYASRVKYICGILDLSNITSGTLSYAFRGQYLQEVRLKNVKVSIDFYANSFSAVLSAETIHYMIANATNTSAITLTFHPTAKARWEASEYFAEDSQTIVTKQITIA